MSEASNADQPQSGGATDSQPSDALSHAESRAVDARKGSSPRVTHEVVRLQGDEELDRPVVSLALSGLAAGAAISASVFAEAALSLALGHSPSAELVSGLGYGFGFLIVILGRLQLFTETTITAVLPLANNPTLHNLGRLARLWAVVLLANLAGTFIVAAAINSGAITSPALHGEIIRMGSKLGGMGGWTVFGTAIPAGFLVATIAWILPNARGSEPAVILAVTYLIAIACFSHVIAGSTEVWTALLAGAIDLRAATLGFVLPALAGNILGGTGLFTMLAHGQVKAEL